MLNIKHLSSPKMKSTGDCWQAILMLITCLQPLLYERLHLPTPNSWRKKENREENEESLPGKKFYTSEITGMATLTDGYWYYAKMWLFPFGFVSDKSKTWLTLLFMVSGQSCGISVLNSSILGSFRTVPTVSHRQIKMQIITKTVGKVRASFLFCRVGVATNQRQWRKFPKIIFLFNRGRWENVSSSKWHHLLLVLELWVWVQGFGEQREGNLVDWDQIWSPSNHPVEIFQALCEICAQTVASERLLNP